MGATGRRLALWTACFAQLIVVLDVSVVNVALPSIQDDLGLDAISASWVALAYSLGFAGVLLVGARLADVVGTARLLAFGVGAFTLASLVGGLATEGWVLITARAAQGVSAATVSPATFTLLLTTHEEGPRRTRAIAVWTAVSLAGGGVGNIASGVLTDFISWRATLLINLPIGAGVLLAALMLRRHVDRERRSARLGLRGAVLATGAFTAATYAVSTSSGHAARGVPAAAGLAALVLFALLLLEQRTARHKLVPTALLRDRQILLGNLATALTGACFQIGLWFFLTYRMQAQLGYSPVQAGMAFLPLTATMLAVNLWLTPRLMDRYRPHLLVVAGSTTTIVGLLWLALIARGPFAVTIFLPTVIVAFGGGLMNTPLATLVTDGVRTEHAGAASGLMNTAKQFGGAVGLAAATAIPGGSSDGAPFAFMAAVIAAVIVVIGAMRTARGAPKASKDRCS